MNRLKRQTGIFATALFVFGAAQTATAQEQTFKRATPVPVDPRPGQLSTTETPEQDRELCDKVNFSLTPFGLGVRCVKENSTLNDEVLSTVFAIGEDEGLMMQGAVTMLSQFNLLDRGATGEISIRYRAASTSNERQTCQIVGSGNDCARIVELEWER